MNNTSPVTAQETESRKLRHVVLFQFKESSTDEQVQRVVDAFVALPGKIDTITDFEYGTNNSPENLADGFTHCFTVTFDSEQGRATYLPHPAHKEFVEVLKPHLEKALVFDYWAD
nr:Dabb family protein [Roseimaritima sediminicola]